MANRGNLIFPLILVLGCGSEGPQSPGAGGDGNVGAMSGGSGGAGASSGGGANPGTGGLQGLDTTALLDCASGQVACNGMCLSPGESSMGCTYLAFIESAEGNVQGFDVRGDSIYVGLVKLGDEPDEVRVFDKATGALRYQVPGQGGTIQQVEVTETHLGWTENASGTLNLYAAPLGSTQSSLVHSLPGFTDISAVSSGWVVPETGATLELELMFVPSAGGEPQPLGLMGDGIDEHPVLESAGSLVYQTGDLLDPDSLWRAPLSGGTPQLITEVAGCDAFYVDETDLYLVENAGSSTDPRHISRVPLSGGTPVRISEQLADDRIFFLAGYGEFLYTTESQRVDPADDNSGWIARLVRVAKSTGAMTDIAVTDHGMFDMHADASGVYFTHFSTEGEAILRMQ